MVKISVGLSGGVDSSVAAAILIEQGFDVEGIYTYTTSSADNLQNGQIPVPDTARRTADMLGIPLKILDLREAFKTYVLDYFADSYLSGRTPNPCVICNRKIRWEILMREVLESGSQYLATGHYARVSKDPEPGLLMRGNDPSKDQSYFLSMIPRAMLQHTLFPIGHLSKEEVRSIAVRMNLPTADQRESQDLCFTAGYDYWDFIKNHNAVADSPGPIIDNNGQQIGIHKGLGMYTIGQRKGIEISAANPYYVIGKNISTNALIVGSHADRFRTTFQSENLVWKTPSFYVGEDITVRVRYNGLEVRAALTKRDDTAEVCLEKPLPDITPGQVCAFYLQQYCVGGGFITL